MGGLVNQLMTAAGQLRLGCQCGQWVQGAIAAGVETRRGYGRLRCF